MNPTGVCPVQSGLCTIMRHEQEVELLQAVKTMKSLLIKVLYTHITLSRKARAVTVGQLIGQLLMNSRVGRICPFYWPHVQRVRGHNSKSLILCA